MKYKSLILTFALFSVSNYSYADWKIYCGEASPSISYEAARLFGKGSGATLPAEQALYVVGLPPVIKPSDAAKGISANVAVKCSLAQSKEIREFKTNDNWQNYNVFGVWSPRVSQQSLNGQYLLPYTGGKDNSDIGGVYSGSIRHPNNIKQWYKIANNQITANVFRFKPTAGIIPAGTQLFKMELRGRADLPGADEAFNVFVPVRTSSEVRILEPTCDFSTPSASITLDNYNAGANTSKRIPINLQCNTNNTINITFIGTTVDSNRTVFKNTETNNPAKGIGFKIVDIYNKTIKAGEPVAYNITADVLTSLFNAEYAPEPSSTVKAGNVKSVVNIQMEYN
ncbi:fimbrial protein [Proteus vulgaris]|uniref:fimbrial protein n=1 Tax=Proteus vulgaris TaxID=585 RepID=UPI0034D5BC66